VITQALRRRMLCHCDQLYRQTKNPQPAQSAITSFADALTEKKYAPTDAEQQ